MRKVLFVHSGVIWVDHNWRWQTLRAKYELLLHSKKVDQTGLMELLHVHRPDVLVVSTYQKVSQDVLRVARRLGIRLLIVADNNHGQLDKDYAGRLGITVCNTCYSSRVAGNIKRRNRLEEVIDGYYAGKPINAINQPAEDSAMSKSEMAKGLLKSTRWPICVVAGLMVVDSCALASLPISNAVFIAVVVTLIAMATMVVNDYCDRESDAQFGRAFAADNAVLFLVFVRWFWGMCILASLSLSLLDYRLALLALGLCAIGLLYSCTRRIILFPALTVAAASAIAAITPCLVRPTLSVAVFATAIFLAIVAQEIAKDIVDRRQDQFSGWKKTLPVALGSYVSAIVVRIVWAVAMVVMLVLPWTYLVEPVIWAFVLMLSAISTAALIITESTATKAKLLAQASFGIFLLVTACYQYRLQTEGDLLKMSPWLGVLALVALTCIIGRSYSQCHEQDDSGPVKASRSKLLIWILMGCLMGAVVWTLRTLFIESLPRFGQVHDATMLTCASLGWLVVMLLGNMTYNWASGRQIIRNMSLGLSIGLLAVAGEMVGIRAHISALVIPLCSILFLGSDHPLTSLLKNRGCQLGLLTSMSILFGMQYAAASFAFAALFVFPAYYLRALQQGVKIPPLFQKWWIPNPNGS